MAQRRWLLSNRVFRSIFRSVRLSIAAFHSTSARPPMRRLSGLVNVQLLLTGVILILGFVVFAVAVMLPERGGIGRRVWSVPHEEVGRNPRIWRVANLLFTASGIASAVGVLLVSVFLWVEGSQLLAPVAGVLFLIGSLLWIVFSEYRATVIPWAADHWAQEGETPSTYKPLSLWAYRLGSVYMMLAYLSAAALGGALLEVGFLASWIGYSAILWGSALAGILAIGWPKTAGEEGTIAHIPAWAQIVPAVIGIALIVEAI